MDINIVEKDEIKVFYNEEANIDNNVIDAGIPV